MEEQYTEDELWASIEAGERKLAMARQRRRRSQKWLVALAVLFLVVVPLGIIAGMIAGRAPRAPLFVVTWPRPKVQQVIAPGQILLGREGQPWTLSVTNAERWDITWRVGDVESAGSEFNWTPGATAGEVTAFCRPIVNDWTANFSFLWPTREIKLSSIVAQSTSNYGRKVETGSSGVWVYPHVFAGGHVAWDERALPLLASAIELVPHNQLSGNLANVGDAPTEKLWQLVSDFEGSTEQPSQNGTFAALHGPSVDESIRAIASRIVKTAPEVSVKFILRLDKDPDEAILRLDYDGKKERKAWVKNPGETAGAPLTGWETGEYGQSSAEELPPSEPQN